MLDSEKKWDPLHTIGTKRCGRVLSWFREMWDSEGGGKIGGHPLGVKFFGGGDP